MFVIEFLVYYLCYFVLYNNIWAKQWRVDLHKCTMFLKTCPLKWAPLGYIGRSVWRSEPAHALSPVSLPSAETPSRSSCNQSVNAQDHTGVQRECLMQIFSIKAFYLAIYFSRTISRIWFFFGCWNTSTVKLKLWTTQHSKPITFLTITYILNNVKLHLSLYVFLSIHNFVRHLFLQ